MTEKKTPKPKKAEKTATVTGEELAEYLGLTGRRVRQLKQEGIVIGAANGHYELKASIQNYIEFLKEKVDARNADQLRNDIELEKLLHERVKKRKSELMVAQLENKLHREEDVERVWSNMVVATKARLLAIPVRISPLLVGEDDINEIQAIIKREIYEALNEVADYDPAAFEVKVDAYEREGEDQG